MKKLIKKIILWAFPEYGLTVNVNPVQAEFQKLYYYPSTKKVSLSRQLIDASDEKVYQTTDENDHIALDRRRVSGKPLELDTVINLLLEATGLELEFVPATSPVVRVKRQQRGGK